MSRARILPLLAWLAAMALGVAVVLQARFTADLSAFLPSSPTPEQQVLVDQLKDGMVSRLLLVGIEGGDADTRAEASRHMAKLLRTDPAFGTVANGEPIHQDRDRAILFENRYLLSPAVTPERFTEAGLREAIGESVDLLASPLGMFTKELLPRDPTGELLRLLERLDDGSRPALFDGTWASRDGARALLLAQTRAAGSDMDGQQAAIARIHDAFAAAKAELGGAGQALKLLLTGPGVFAVESRATIQAEVTRLALVAMGLIVALLLFVYRSATALLLGLLPVASGALAGITAVSLGFGTVHGVTLGFGTTLIGEAVDYAIYLFVQAGRGGASAKQPAFWPTIRLGVMTSICGFAALLFSGFPGLAQLGLYSIAGLLAAAATARFVLPQLLPTGFSVRDVTPLGLRLQRLTMVASRLRWALAALMLLAVAFVLVERDRVWNHELAALSPVSAEDQALDQSLRGDLGAPDVRYVVVVGAPEREAALAAAEAVGRRLQSLADEDAIGGYESPAHFLPAHETQLARRASLPPADELARRLEVATADLPLPAERLSPFVADVAAARERAPLTRADLEGSSFALAVDSLLVEQSGRWNALLPLRAPSGGEIDAEAVRAALADSGAGALFIDMKGESDRLYSGYLQEAIYLSLAGLAAIVVLLALALRSMESVLRVLAPLAAAVLAVIALLVASGVALNILHLVGLLLIVAVGSNYALFFSHRPDAAGPAAHTLASMLFANVTTVAGFGVLALSSVPVLQAFGATVGPGAILALLFSAIVAKAPDARRNQAAGDAPAKAASTPAP